MRTKKVSSGLTAVLAAFAVCLFMTGALAAGQTETVLYNFNAKSGGPYGPCLSLTFDASGNLYGTARNGGAGYGVPGGEIFELMPAAGGGWTTKFLFDFKNGTEGSTPNCGLVRDALGNIYGTTFSGGFEFWGTAFELSPNSDGSWTEKVLHYFGKPATDGEVPLAGLVSDPAGNLYGTTELGGANGTGAVFELAPQPDGAWTEKVLYSFGTGTDGQAPGSSLIFDSAGNLYGTTLAGGANDGGTVFELLPKSGGRWVETVLYSFAAASEPSASLIFDSAGNLYSTTIGSVFELSPAGGGTWTEKTLHTFSGSVDGFNVFSGLTFDKFGNLYGATASGGIYGGANGFGTVFKLTPEVGGNWSKTTLFNFDRKDGSVPAYGNLIFDAAGNLYGGAGGGGEYDWGAVFEITP